LLILVLLKEMRRGDGERRGEKGEDSDEIFCEQVTLAKEGTLHARRQALAFIQVASTASFPPTTPFFSFAVEIE
jgi:hypothetical protein